MNVNPHILVQAIEVRHDERIRQAETSRLARTSRKRWFRLPGARASAWLSRVERAAQRVPGSLESHS